MLQNLGRAPPCWTANLNNLTTTNLKRPRQGKMFGKFSPNFAILLFVIRVNLLWTSLTILVPLWFIIISLVFFYLCKVLFSGFLPF